MKKTWFALLSVLAFVLPEAGGREVPHVSLTEKVPPRSIQIGKKNAAVLTAENCTIVADKSASKVTRFAAEELKIFLEGIFRKKVQLSNTPGKGINLYVGFGKFSKANKVDPAGLPRDGFIIRTYGKDILIAGRDDEKIDPKRAMKGGVWNQMYERATLFGVYDFLERFCGCRFYFPGELGTVVPRKDSLTIPECRIFERPDFLVRKYSAYWDGIYLEGTEKERNTKLHPSKTLNLYRLRSETAYLPTNHGMARFDLLRRFGKTHPEYFAMTDTGKRRTETTGMFAGHICWSSPVTEVLYQDMKAYLTGKPASSRDITLNGKSEWPFMSFRGPYVDIMPQDGFYACRCPECQAKFTKDPDYATNVVLGQTIEWAKRLKKENIPGIVCAMAYFPYRTVPEGVELPDNLMIMVADTGPWNEGGKPGARGRVASGKNQRFGAAEWHKALGRKVWVWNYNYKQGALAMPGIPSPSPRAVGRYYTAVAPDIFGAYMASNSDRFSYNIMSYYVFSKLAWNNRTDYNAVLDEFYKLMFGPAEKEMKSILEEFEDNWIWKITGRVVNTAAGPVNTTPSENELWNKIYSPEKIKSLVKRFDKALALAGKNTLEGRRVELFRNEYLVPLQKESKAYFARNNAVSVFTFPEGAVLHLLPVSIRGEIKPEIVKTAVTAKRENGFLHVVFDCEEPKMDKVVSFDRKHDYPMLYQDNEIEFFLNPSGDRKTYYQWIVNSNGSMTDIRWTRIAGSQKAKDDIAWESGAKASSAKTKTGFRITLDIPLKSLPEFAKEGVPVNFTRSRTLSNEPDAQREYRWTPFGSGNHDVDNFGRMLPADRELIRDGGFTGLTEKRGYLWYKEKNLSWSARYAEKGKTYAEIDNSVFFGAPCSMKIVSNRKEGNFVAQQIRKKLKPGKRYRLSGMVKLENVVPASRHGGFAFQFIDDGNHFYPKHNLLRGTTDWIPMSFEFATSLEVEKAKMVTLRCNLLQSTGTVWVDHISLEEL